MTTLDFYRFSPSVREALKIHEDELVVLSDNLISPAATITSPHRDARA